MAAGMAQAAVLGILLAAGHWSTAQPQEMEQQIEVGVNGGEVMVVINRVVQVVVVSAR